MLIDKLQRYVTETLYRDDEVYVLNNYTRLNHNLLECEKRVLDVLSLGEYTRLHQFVDHFPWEQLEELMGSHLRTAIHLTSKKSQLAVVNKEPYLPNIFDKYMFHHRIDYLNF